MRIVTATLLAALPTLAVAAPLGFSVDVPANPLVVLVADAPVSVTNAWSRATAKQQDTGAAYFTITSPQADQLTSASTPVAGMAQVHEMTMDGAIMRMRDVPALALPAGHAVMLKPGGYHVMLMHLKAPLTVGQTFPMHLTFAHAAPADVTVTVGTAGAAGPAGSKP